MPVVQFPDWFKRPLVPLWNAAHQLAWHSSELAGAVFHWRFEQCAVCGCHGLMVFRRRVIPKRLEQLWGLSPRVGTALARKESLDCLHCGAQLRARRLAAVLLDLFPVGDRAIHSSSIADWTLAPTSRQLHIAEINVIPGLHSYLKMLPGLVASDFREPGAFRGHADDLPSEDLTRLSFANSSFDVVLTSETLEHVPDFDAALRELHRVLKPKGVHVFTIPLLPGIARTNRRAARREDGAIEVLVPPLLHHPGGDAGYPVFTEFGADLPEILEKAGFQAELHFGPITESDLAQVWVCRKK